MELQYQPHRGSVADVNESRREGDFGWKHTDFKGKCLMSEEFVPWTDGVDDILTDDILANFPDNNISAQSLGW